MNCRFRKTSEQIKQQEERKNERYQRMGIYPTQRTVTLNNGKQETIWTTRPIMNTFAVS
jgi:hypothetical protein